MCLLFSYLLLSTLIVFGRKHNHAPYCTAYIHSSLKRPLVLTSASDFSDTRSGVITSGACLFLFQQVMGPAHLRYTPEEFSDLRFFFRYIEHLRQAGFSSTDIVNWIRGEIEALIEIEEHTDHSAYFKLFGATRASHPHI